MEETGADSNSDSDSVDSWTIVDKKMNAESETSEQKDTPKPATREIDDTDADGISVISEEELEASDEASRTSSNTEKNVTVQYQDKKIDIPSGGVTRPVINYSKKDTDSESSSMQGYQEQFCDDFFTESKVRSYIHKRNNKLSNILNMILIGTIITTACLAIGHMWGTTDDCSPEMFSSVSQLAYTMQELQHENYMLKSKLKVLELKRSRMNQLPLILYRLNNYKKLIQDDELDNKDKSTCSCNKEENTTDSINLKDILNTQVNDFKPIDIEEPKQEFTKDVIDNDDYYDNKIYSLEQPQIIEKVEQPRHIHKREVPKNHQRSFKPNNSYKSPYDEDLYEIEKTGYERHIPDRVYNYEHDNWKRNHKMEMKNGKKYKDNWKFKEQKENIPHYKYKQKEKVYKEYPRKEKDVKNFKNKNYPYQKHKYQEYNKKDKIYNPNNKKERRILNV